MKEFKLALVIQNIKGAKNKSVNNSVELSRSQFEKRKNKDKNKMKDVSIDEVDRSSDIATNNFLKITSLRDRQDKINSIRNAIFKEFEVLEVKDNSMEIIDAPQTRDGSGISPVDDMENDIQFIT